MQRDMTRGSVTKTILLFALPMIFGNLLQQLYNVADTLIVGRFLGTAALGAVGSSYTLMTFITSILLGLSMGSGAVFSIHWGERDMEKLKESIGTSFVIIALLAAALTAAAFAALDVTLRLLQVPAENYDLMRAYLLVIFVGIPATFLYNYFACLLRSVGNSVIPLVFLGVSAVTNIVLDLLFVVEFEWGVEGAAWATVIAQYLSGVGLVVYTALHFSYLRPQRHHFRLKRENIREISQFAFLTCAQQSVMNFGILMVQGRVNYFGPAVMAAFAAAVKIDSFAYMPVQDFGNAFSTFIAQNYGARRPERIRRGIRSAVGSATVFCIILSAAVFLLAKPLMMIFIDASEAEDSFHRRDLSSHRGRILSRYRVPLAPLWSLSRHRAASHERRPYLYLSRD